MTARIMAAIGAVLVLTIIVLALMVRHYRRAEFDAALAADTLEAHADTNRTHVLSPRDSMRLLGDSLAIVQRRAIQVKQSRDELDRALGLERRAKIQLQVRVTQLEARDVTGTPVRVDSSTDVRTASFTVDTIPPYHVEATVSLPPPPKPGVLNRLRVSIDSIPITARLQCGKKNEFGVRLAQVTLTGPTWAPLAIERTEQDPATCGNEPPTSFWKRLLRSCGIGPTYSIILTRLSPFRVEQGPGVGASCAVFP